MSANSVIEKVFASIDVDGSGSITSNEMEHCFKLFDKDGNGSVSADEWSAGFVANFGGTLAQAEKVFKHLDKAGKGDFIAKALEELFKEMDSDGSGDVSKEEFQAFWMKLLS